MATVVEDCCEAVSMVQLDQECQPHLSYWALLESNLISSELK